MSSWTSYPKLYNLGHKLIQDLFKTDVRIEEKVDGSQFSFGNIDGKLKVKSKNAEINLDDVPKLFKPAVEAVLSLFQKDLLLPNATYRGEAFYGPKHNSLAYGRAPEGGIMLFDVAVASENYMPRDELVREGARLGLEVVPCYYEGKIESFAELKKYFELDSILGGAKIEGVVVKGPQFMTDGKPMYGKFVSEAFKEVHYKDWKNRNPSQNDILLGLSEMFRTQARWNKSIQHMRDAGTLTDTPKDIGTLIKNIQDDIKAECEDMIKDELFKWAWPKISRTLVNGFPQFYKEILAEKQFSEP